MSRAWVSEWFYADDFDVGGIDIFVDGLLLDEPREMPLDLSALDDGRLMRMLADARRSAADCYSPVASGHLVDAYRSIPDPPPGESSAAKGRRQVLGDRFEAMALAECALYGFSLETDVSPRHPYDSMDPVADACGTILVHA